MGVLSLAIPRLELLAGAILAVAADANRRPHASEGWLKLLGLVLIGSSLVLIHEAKSFGLPGRASRGGHRVVDLVGRTIHRN